MPGIGRHARNGVRGTAYAKVESLQHALALEHLANFIEGSLDVALWIAGLADAGDVRELLATLLEKYDGLRPAKLM